MTRFLSISALLLAGNAWGQVSSPLLGYVPDGAHVRPVNGIPASAAIAGTLDLKQDFSNIVVSPAHDYVLVTSTKSGTVSAYTAAHGLTPVPGAGASPQLVVTSPRGSSAVLWFSSGNRAQLVTGLPGAPVIRQINASFLRTMPTSLAISDDGKWMAGAWSSGLYVWGPYGQMNRLQLEDSVSAVAFFQGRTDLAVAIPHRVVTMNAVDIFGGPTILYDSSDWDPDVAAVAVSADNARVILADRTGWIVSIDTASDVATKPVKVDCGCQPTGLFGMGQSAFRLTAMANGSFQLFDAVHNEVLFAPLALSEAEKGAGESQ